MNIQIPELCLVVLIGASGSGKSTFARRHFAATEVLSSDACRGLVSDDENDQAASRDAFEVLNFIAAKRLAAGRLTVVDATNVQRDARKPLVELARRHHCLPVAIVMDMDPKLCHARNQERADRDFGSHVVRRQAQQLKRSLKGLKREGFRHVRVLDSPEEAEAVRIERQRLWTNLRHEHGPFDIIGDVHGCHEELTILLRTLGYSLDDDGMRATPPVGRKALFLGDLVDRGPASPGVLRLVMSMHAAGNAIVVPGNHDVKLMRKLSGRNVRITHGLAETLEQLEREPEAFRAQVGEFIDGLVSHYVLDEGALVAAHAGMREELQGRASGKVREFALYGETTGETDEYGLPVRHDWAADYRGRAMVVYGHTPVPEAEWVNGTICLDTGCVFGGKLTALRYPERELVQVPATRVHYEPARPFPIQEGIADAVPARRAYNDLLDIADVCGKRIVTTRVHHSVTVREENAAAALEVMTRFAVDPRWLIYLPPTMSPSETAGEGDYLEHPREAFAYFRGQGVGRAICQEKHMGSRAITILCRDPEAAKRRFGIESPNGGIVYTRTGRAFFSDASLERALLARLREAAVAAGLFEELETDWMCLDGELMPWSAKARELLRTQYAAVGAAGSAAITASAAAVAKARDRGIDTGALDTRFEERARALTAYVDAYGRYCWNVDTVDDYRFAPFHLIASEGHVHSDRSHAWHMQTLARLAAAPGGVVLATVTREVDLTDTESEAAATAWWVSLTEEGSEGMVVKPLEWIVRGQRGLVQPAVKCRGREYLRIIYGPEYTLPEHLERLRRRGLGHKRSLALREYALGLEGLHRFVEGEPLHRVHECAFGVLALESEPIDPRL